MKAPTAALSSSPRAFTSPERLILPTTSGPGPAPDRRHGGSYPGGVGPRRPRTRGAGRWRPPPHGRHPPESPLPRRAPALPVPPSARGGSSPAPGSGDSGPDEPPIPPWSCVLTSLLYGTCMGLDSWTPSIWTPPAGAPLPERREGGRVKSERIFAFSTWTRASADPTPRLTPQLAMPSRPVMDRMDTLRRTPSPASPSDEPISDEPSSHEPSPGNVEPDGAPVELAVIGAGPCGIAVGAAARRMGLSTALFDQGPLCDSILRYPTYMTFFSTPEKLEIEGLPFVTSEKTATRKEALTYYRKVADYFQLPVYQYHRVVEVKRDSDVFLITTRDGAGREARHRARRVAVATGGFHEPNLLGVPGEDLPKVSHHYREAHPYWRQDVLVVGGSNSAVEASLELFRAGARVHMVHFGNEFDRGVKPWILPDIQNRIRNGEIGMAWAHRVHEIRPDAVVLRSEASGETTELRNDWVLALTGWKANPTILGSLGVPVDDVTGIPAHNPHTMETPVDGVFIAGVLAAGHDANRIFIENGREHGRLIVEAVLAGSPESRGAS
ncbi:MAG: YpdA family putative bacillithiol disulfide reductase [Gemmatimonadales bacterium]|nr:MAG: YpdA family putative bacillithiol disulfide reductase [Gemmatimonadales bacterium]